MKNKGTSEQQASVRSINIARKKIIVYQAEFCKMYMTTASGGRIGITEKWDLVSVLLLKK